MSKITPESLFRNGVGQAGLKRANKPTTWSAWYDTAIIPLYVAIGGGSAMCAYVCGRNLTSHPDIVWNKHRTADSKVQSLGNTAGSYREQRLFLAAGTENSIKLWGGGLTRGKNSIIGPKMEAKGGH